MVEKFTEVGKKYLKGQKDFQEEVVPQLVTKKGKESFLYFFTEDATELLLHYAEGLSQRGVFKCSGETCLLCKINNLPKVRYFLPVFNLATRRVEVISMGEPSEETSQKRSLFAQLYDFLKDEQQRAAKMAVIKRLTHFFYYVEKKSLNGFDKGDVEIKDFLASYQKGDVSITPYYPIFTEDLLSEYPVVANLLKLCEL